MDYDVHSNIASCFTCQSCDKTAQMCLAPLQPFQKVAIDIAGPFVGDTHDFAITMVDYYSKWPEVAFTSNVTKFLPKLQSFLTRNHRGICF